MRLSRCHLSFTISLSSPSTRRMCSSFLNFAIFGFAKWFTHGPADPTILLRSDLVCFGLLWFALICFGCPSPPETPLGVPGSRVISGVGRPRLVSTHRRYASTGSLPESAAGDAAVRSCHPPPAPPYAPLRKDREWWRVRPTHPCSNEDFYSRAAPLIPTFSASALN